MNDPAVLRLSLILPIHSRAASAGAVQSVFYVLLLARVELDLLRSARDASLPRRRLSPGGLLFLAADITGVADRAAFEADLRSRIVNAYARAGITSVRYHLELL